MKNKLLIICGPTATGKTAIAAMLAKKFNGELISADSRQVYRGMDLVTGKDGPACAGRPDVPVWLYDLINPDEEFSVSHWVRLAKNAIADIQKRNKLPIVVGGTGLYIHALLNPLETINIPPNQRLRKKLQRMTVGELQHMISRGSMNQSDWNNPRRLIRKIEITQSKTEMSKPRNRFDYLMIGLTAPLPVLYERIDERLENRMRAGLEEEIASLCARYNRNLPSMSAIGLNEHAYARRQLTWFKKQSGIHWFTITKSGFQADVTAEVGTWYTEGQ